MPPEKFSELRSLRSENDFNKAILDDFASRTNNQKTTTVDGLLKRLHDLEMPRGAPIQLFRELERQDYGRFVEGRKGRKSRFLWSSSSIEVGKAAKGENVSITPVASGQAEEDDAAEMIAHKFYLRDGLFVTFNLPADFTEKEAERLGGFLRSLPV